MRVALVYDRLNKWGGAERVLLALHEIWPQAPLYTAVYNPKTAPWAKDFKVVPSFLNKFPFAKKHHEIYPWATPLAFESFNFDEYDVVISVTSEAAKGIITKPETCYICYCLTPTRYLWSGYEDYFKNSIQRLVSKPVVSYLRKWDKIAASRPDYYLAISENVRSRIKKYYGRDSEVIYPPADTEKWKIENGKWKMGKFFLIVSRLVAYKKIDIVVRAFNELGLPLKIVGIGGEMGRLKKMAKNNIEFLGYLTDRELVGYYQNCQAVIFPQEEDFGLVPLEAQSCGRPVIAFQAGGALETIVEKQTGLFFRPQTIGALAKVVRKFEKMRFDPEVCRRNALKFDSEMFKKKFKAFIEDKWKTLK